MASSRKLSTTTLLRLSRTVPLRKGGSAGDRAGDLVSAYLVALREEAADAAARSTTVIRNFWPDASANTLPTIHIEETLDVKAYARRPLRVFVSLGMVIAIEEALLQVLTRQDFFDLTDGAEWQSDEPLRLSDVGPSAGGSDGDGDLPYSLRGSPRPRLHLPMPIDHWRLCQYELLRDLSLDWLLLHEVSHWVDGHLGLLDEMAAAAGTRAISAIGLCDHGGDRHDPRPMKRVRRALSRSDVRKGIELRADHLGFGFLAAAALGTTSRLKGPFARYVRRLRALDLPSTLAGLPRMSRAQRVRSMVVAAGTVMLVIERLVRSAGRGLGYPMPMARLMNIQMAVLTISIYVEERRNSIVLTADGEEPSFRNYLSEALFRPLIDLNAACRTLGLMPLLGVPAEGLGAFEAAAPHVRDIITWLSSGGNDLVD